jgi:hypothetical protein
MSVQYVVAKDEETNKVEIIGRFNNGIGEIFRNGKWEHDGFIYQLQMDAFLENITEVEAMKLIEETQNRQLQVA